MNCQAVQAGPERTPLIRQFVSSAAMQKAVDEEADKVNSSGDCATGGEYVGTWHQNGITRGHLVCRYDSGEFRIFWSYFNENIAVVAEAPDARALYSWWSNVSVFHS